MSLNFLLKLAELGYKLFPLLVGSKHPNGRLAPNGRNDATSDQEKVMAWYKAAPMSNWGLATDDMLVVDIDGKDNPWPTDPEQAAELAECGAIAITGRGGRHHIFGKPEGKGWRSTAGKIAEHVDTRTCGGYIVLAGSTVTTDGKAGTYQWVDGMELTTPIDRLPPPPPWLIAQLDNLTNRPPSNGTGHKAAGENKFPEGRRNSSMFSLACALRRMGMHELEILAALMVANDARCEPPLDESEVESIAERASKYEPDQLAADMVSGELDDIDISALIGESISEENASHKHDDLPSHKNPGDMPEELMKPAGFIGEFMHYVDRNCHKRQPVLAMAAGITLQSLAVGRRVTDRKGTRPNIYCIGTAPAGQGKEAARKCIKNILCEAKAHAQLSEGVASHSGLITAIHKSPRMILLVDEIGRWLKTVANPGAAPHLYAVVTNLMKLYSSADSIYIGDNYADPEKNKVINQPHCALYGTTVPKSLYESLTSESITDGFLARVFVFEGEKKAERVIANEDDSDGQTDTECVKKLAKTFSEWEATNRGNMPEDLFEPTMNPDGDKRPTLLVATESTEARAAFLNLQNEMDEKEVTGHDDTEALWTRCEEKAHTLALIHACSRVGPPPENREDYRLEITKEDAEWGIKLAKFLTEKLVWLCHMWISNGAFDSKRRAVLRYIADNTDKGGSSKTMLIRKFSYIKVKELDEVIDNLKRGEFIVGKKIKSKKTGPTPDVFISTGKTEK